MVTAVVLARNEGKVLNSCLNSLLFCDEIIVIDDNSTDETPKIAQSMGAKVYSHALNGDFATQRNFAMEKAVGEWVLFVDADEEVSPELKSEIKKKTKSRGQSDMSAYYIKRRDIFWGRELYYGDVYTAASKGIIRLVKKNSGKWQGKVHEVFETGGKIGMLENYLIHRPHQTVKEFLQEVNTYSSLRADELFKKGLKTNILAIFFFPAVKFIHTYFFRRGFLDGAAGFIYCFMMSFHSFLVKAKLYLKTGGVDTNTPSVW